MDIDPWSNIINNDIELRRQVRLWRWIACILFYIGIVGWLGLLKILAPISTPAQLEVLVAGYCAAAVVIFVIPAAYMWLQPSTITHILIAACITAVAAICMAKGVALNAAKVPEPNIFDQFDPPRQKTQLDVVDPFKKDAAMEELQGNLNTRSAQWYKIYPFLQMESPQSNTVAIRAVISRRDELLSAGVQAIPALDQAVQEVAPRYVAQPPQPVDPGAASTRAPVSADPVWDADMATFLRGNCQFRDSRNSALLSETMQTLINQYHDASNMFLLNLGGVTARRDARFIAIDCR